MSKFNNERLNIEVFKMDSEVIENIRNGWYSDDYFNNTAKMLTQLAKEGYEFGDKENDLQGIVDVSKVQNGNLEVEMQFFTRRKPFAVVCGVDEALRILEVGTGYRDENGEFISTFDKLEIEAVHDGDIVRNDGSNENLKPVLKVRGRYRDFAHLETILLGVLAVPTRVATNVYKVLVASKGKDVLFFPARFNHYKMQGVDGYAYWIATQRYDVDYGKKTNTSVSTGEQGNWWGGNAGGTISHATIASFLGNTAETMLQFSRIMPVETPRIALIDFHNDCIGETEKVIDVLWKEYWKNYKAGNFEEAKKFKLYGVRPDTSGNMRDKSIEPTYNKDFDNGVTPKLVHNIRVAMDNYYKNLIKDYNFEDLQKATPVAKEFCESIKIAVTGGFNAETIERFEEVHAPVDIYGVGSSLLENASCNGTKTDFTADIVRVKIGEDYHNLSKVGRTVCFNEDLMKIQ